MIKNERLSKILEILEKEKFCTTEYLANKLYVVPVTIRRDLKILEQEGLVSKCYGGVSIISHDNRDVPYIVRENFNSDIKSNLAKQAVKLIETGSTVFLDASSTASHIANMLSPEMDVTVITNGINTGTILSQKNIKTYCTGGKLVNNSLACTGSIALNAISSMHADYTFFSSQGIDEYGNITDFSESETQLRKTMIEHSDKRYFVCDSSKIGKVFLFSVCNISDIDGIICDKVFDNIKK